MLFTQSAQTFILTTQRVLLTALTTMIAEHLLSSYRDLEVLNTIRTDLVTKRHGIIRILRRSKALGIAVFSAAVVISGFNLYPFCMTRLFPVRLRIDMGNIGPNNWLYDRNALRSITLDIGPQSENELSFSSNSGTESYLEELTEGFMPIIDLVVAANWSRSDNNMSDTTIRKSGLVGSYDSSMIKNYSMTQSGNYLSVEASAGINVPELINLSDQYLLRQVADTYLNNTLPFDESVISSVVPSPTIGHNTNSRYAYAGFYASLNLQFWQEVSSIYWDTSYPADCSYEILNLQDYADNLTAVCNYANQVNDESGSYLKAIFLEEDDGWIVTTAAVSTIFNGIRKIRFLALRKRISILKPNVLGENIGGAVPATWEIHGSQSISITDSLQPNASSPTGSTKRSLTRRSVTDLTSIQLAYIRLFLVQYAGFSGLTGVQDARVTEAADMNLAMVLVIYLVPLVAIGTKILINRRRPHTLMAFASNSVWDMVLSSTTTEELSCSTPLKCPIYATINTTGKGAHTLLEVNGKSLVRLHIATDEEALFTEDTKGRYLHTLCNNTYLSKLINKLAAHCCAHTSLNLSRLKSDELLQDSAFNLSMYAKPLVCVAAIAFLSNVGNGHIDAFQLETIDRISCNINMKIAVFELLGMFSDNAQYFVAPEYRSLTISQALQLCGSSDDIYMQVCDILYLANHLHNEDPVSARDYLTNWLSHKLFDHTGYGNDGKQGNRKGDMWAGLMEHKSSAVQESSIAKKKSL